MKCIFHGDTDGRCAGAIVAYFTNNYNKEDYYDALQMSSYNWDNEENNYSYFVKYYLGIIMNLINNII